MAEALDDYAYCSPFLDVVSLDALYGQADESGRPFDVCDPQPGADIQFDCRRACEKIRCVIEDLSPRQKEVISKILAGYTLAQTARNLRISTPAVVRLRDRAFKRMRDLLASEREVLLV